MDIYGILVVFNRINRRKGQTMQFFRRLKWRWRCRRREKVLRSPEEVKRLFPSSMPPLMEMIKGMKGVEPPVYMGVDPAVEGSDCSTVVLMRPSPFGETLFEFPRGAGKTALMKALKERDKHGQTGSH